jgi:predicted RNA methylase
LQLDKFYTKPEIANKYIDIVKEKLNIGIFDYILEPSAGNGSFSNILFSMFENVVALDIEPEEERINKQNFFDFVPEENKKYLVIGNPPFGKVSSLAFKFVEKSCSFANTVAFILPRTFKRVSFKNKINSYFHLIFEEDIPMKSFYPEAMMAKCCFQIWERKNEPRGKISLDDKTDDFIILPLKEKLKANFASRAYGGKCGEISFDIENIAERSWHFIKTDKEKEVIEVIKKMDFSIASDTARQNSIGAKEFIHFYNKVKNT